MKKLFIIALFLFPLGASAACQEATMTFKQNGVITQFSKTCTEEVKVTVPNNEPAPKPKLTYTEIYIPEQPITAKSPELSIVQSHYDQSLGYEYLEEKTNQDEKNVAKGLLLGLIFGGTFVGLMIFLLIKDR